MKFLSTLRNRLRKSMLKDERGQGATEYILLLVVLVGVVIMLKKPIMNKIDEATKKFGSQTDSALND